MATTGNVFPGTGENNAGIGATAWVNPGNVVSDNTTDTTCTAAASSQYLVARNFNFAAVPTNATIGGITVRIEASESSTGSETLNARLQNAAGALTGTGKTASINGTGKIVYTYGSTTDVWGAALTGNVIHDPDFGVRFWYTTAHTMAVDYATMAVEYTAPVPGVSTCANTALGLAVTRLVAVDISAETNTALACTVEIVGGQQIATGLATETAAALGLAATKRAAVGVALTTNTALAVAATKRVASGVSAETDAALAAAARKALPTGAATSTDVALARGWLSLRASEADIALGLSVLKRLSVGVAAETDVAFARPLQSGGIPIGMATSVNVAMALAMARRMAVGAAEETATARALYVATMRHLAAGGCSVRLAPAAVALSGASQQASAVASASVIAECSAASPPVAGGLVGMSAVAIVRIS